MLSVLCDSCNCSSVCTEHFVSIRKPGHCNAKMCHLNITVPFPCYKLFYWTSLEKLLFACDYRVPVSTNISDQ